MFMGGMTVYGWVNCSRMGLLFIHGLICMDLLLMDGLSVHGLVDCLFMDGLSVHAWFDCSWMG